MNKLSLDELKERADSVVNDELLNSISGGTENSCHATSSGNGISWAEVQRRIAIVLAILGQL